jgi:Putative Flp pilus-assembly TadE/G-like
MRGARGQDKPVAFGGASRSARNGQRGGARYFAADTCGSIVVIFALTLPIVLGALGLGIDLGMWFLEKRRMQEAADSAVLDAAFTMRGGGDSTLMQDAADGAAGKSGFSSPYATVTVHNPPNYGNFTSNASAVEVIMTVQHPTYFVRLFGLASVQIQTRAAALVGGDAGEACILALGNYCPTDGSSVNEPISVSGNATLGLEGCTMHADGDCETSMTFDGSSITSSECLSVSNNWDLSGAASIDMDCPAVKTNVHLQDPLAALNSSDPPDCSASTCVATQTLKEAITAGGGTVNPGTYSGAVVNNSGTIHFNPGVYYITGDVRFTGNPDVTGTAVSFVMVGADTDMDLSGTQTVSLSAPAAGVTGDHPTSDWDLYPGSYPGLSDGWSGLLFYSQEVRDSSSGSCPNKFNGNAGFNYTGFFYFPNSCTSFLGNGGTATNTCLMIIADQVNMTGNYTMNNSVETCDASGFPTFGGAKSVLLVE